MKTLFNLLAAALLLFNGIGAIYGGYHLITHTDGSSLQMSTDYLKYSPFDNYLIPGIVLLVMNGLCSFVVIAAMIVKYKNTSLLIIGQGAILTGWIAIQIAMVRMIYYLHFILGGAGLLLILLGFALWRMNKKARS